MGDLFGCAHPPVDSLARKVIEPFLHIAVTDMSAAETCAQHGRIHCAGQDGIDADIIRRKLNRHGARQGKQSAFGGGIGGNIGGGLDCMDRGDIDDRAAACGFEQADAPV